MEGENSVAKFERLMRGLTMGRNSFLRRILRSSIKTTRHSQETSLNRTTIACFSSGIGQSKTKEILKKTNEWISTASIKTITNPAFTIVSIVTKTNHYKILESNKKIHTNCRI